MEKDDIQQIGRIGFIVAVNNFDSEKGILVVEDDGDGMDSSNIDTLLHISKSNKKYAHLNENGRYIQGSKGLGFLSVFKFGNIVTWKTKKDKGYQFTINYDKIKNMDDITSINIEIEKNDNIKKGTTIIINLRKESIDLLSKYLSDPTNLKKILYCFKFKNFNITFKIDNVTYDNLSPTLLDNILPGRQLFHVTYKSDEGKIIFKHNNHIAFEYSYKFNYSEFKADLDLVIFQLKQNLLKDIDPLFKNNAGQLTPLIYVNTNLFNNYTLFDPNVMQKIKYSSIMNQIVGYIHITSSNQKLDFNSDRTQFVENALTNNVSDFINNINITIQTEASKRKKYLIDFNILTQNELSSSYINASEGEYRKIIKRDFAFKDNVSITKNGYLIEYSFLGKSAKATIEHNIKNTPPNQEDNNPDSSNNPQSGHSPTENNYIPAFIKLKSKNMRIKIPTKQINLYNYIESAKNSKNQTINNKKILIKVNNKENKTGILECITRPSLIKVEYLYQDDNTGRTYSELSIEFYQPNSSIIGSSNEDNLISIPAMKSYTINYNNHVDNLIKQINSLKKPEEYNEIISCSLRAIFEISIDTLIKSEKYKDLPLNISGLENRVAAVVEYISKSNDLKTKISNNSGIDFQSLGNLLNKKDYISAIQKAHLAAHKSTTYISENDIKELAKKASIFVIFINELLKLQ